MLDIGVSEHDRLYEDGRFEVIVGTRLLTGDQIDMFRCQPLSKTFATWSFMVISSNEPYMEIVFQPNWNIRAFCVSASLFRE